MIEEGNAIESTTIKIKLTTKHLIDTLRVGDETHDSVIHRNLLKIINGEVVNI